MGSFAGKTAVVVGMGRGRTLGYGVARAFAENGANVVLVGRSASGLKAVASELVLKVERNDEPAIVSAVHDAVEAFGTIDVVVNCMQVAKSGMPVNELGLSDLDLALDTGVKAAFCWMKACYPHLRDSRGCILNFVSRAGREGRCGQAPLAVSKEALAPSRSVLPSK